MTNKLTISLAQLNFTVGDFAGNYRKIVDAHKRAHKQKADLVIVPELAITGYPPEDVILRPYFQQQAMEWVRKLALLTENHTAILMGSPWVEGKHLYNAAILLDEGEIKHISGKSELPNYGVFDEKRIFTAAPLPEPLDFRSHKLGVMVCEELWNRDVAKYLKKKGADILISINASPFEVGKHAIRNAIAKQNISDTSLPLIYLNLVGGQDELLFDGGSFVLSGKGEAVLNMSDFSEDFVTTSWEKTGKTWQCKPDKIEAECGKYEAIYKALKLGLRDYVNKNGFPGVVIGMSGGIDSALSAAIAVDALGKNKVRLVMMPSKYTSRESLEDAAECAGLLQVSLETVPIEDMVEAFTETMAGTFKGTTTDITEENIQSRLRGSILMAISNKFGHMVLTTGNKSEMAVGYATLYGDMCGGFNILKDIYKTEVFALAKWRNQQKRAIPDNIMTKAPTAELRDGQTDQDSLPPYDVLDKILHRLIELRQSSDDIAHNGGFVVETVKKVARLVRLAEYKRRQAAPGVKISPLAFGRDRRYPITNAFEL